MTIPPEAITAAGIALHDEDCDDGDTSNCGRWRSGHYPPGAITHVGYYEAKASKVLEAAARVLRAEGAAAERARIRQLAVDVDAFFMDAQPQPPSYGVVEVDRPFADLLDGDPS